MRYLLVLASLALACGAEAPSPSDADASTDGSGAYDTGNGCPARFVRIGAECVPALDDMCGPTRTRCPSGQSCFIVGGGAGTPTVVRCEPN